MDFDDKYIPLHRYTICLSHGDCLWRVERGPPPAKYGRVNLWEECTKGPYG